ncbi:MAG TPA: Ca2+-dependent phosphoinositide-specific phospholipase C [Iamia sp.]
MRRAALVAVLATGTLVGATGSTPAQAIPEGLRLNQIQVVGSHNSYHLAASPEETAVRREFIGDGDNALQYAHAPLAEQFQEQKVRQIELDAFRDDEGGLYSEPLLREAAGHGPYAGMDEPGTKVLHAQDVDYRSTCLTLVACLEAVEGWSDDNPNHLPIAILLELKDGPVGFPGPFVEPEPWDTEGMDALDEEIRSVVPDDEMITPDDVRGAATTLEDAVLGTGWPMLDDVRGQVMFLMDNSGGYRTDYLVDHASLAGRVMFTNSEPGQDDAAFVKVNDSRADEDRIQDLVADGYMVRTRSDAETVEAREGDVTGREAAFRSGAQWVSTDYPVGEYARPFGTGYVVEIPGGTIARCNPVNGPDGCVSAEIEPFPEREEGPYVQKLYATFFSRSSTNAERWFWARKLEHGASRVSVARALSRTRDIQSGPFVHNAAYGFLDRFLDLESRLYWADYLGRGRPYEHMQVSMIASDEFYARGGGTDEGFVGRIFEKMLEREVDPASLEYFLGRLEAGANRWTIGRQVLASLESRRIRASNDVRFVSGREPTADEVTWFAELLRATRDDRDIAVEVAATDEFHG